jgi:hypothetical protein
MHNIRLDSSITSHLSHPFHHPSQIINVKRIECATKLASQISTPLTRRHDILKLIASVVCDVISVVTELDGARYPQARCFSGV